MKRLLALMTAVVMALSFSVTAMAAEQPATPDLGIIGGADGPTAVIVSTPTGIPGKAGLKGPYDGVNIWLGDKYMAFTDAFPKEINGRTQAPYRAVLEALGAEVTYDNGNIEARFEDGSVMKLAIGSTSMSYTYADGKVNNVAMDVAPFIDDATGRTYVPIRFIGEALGYTVTWNNEFQTAFLIDWDAVEKAVDARFSDFNAMMKALTEAQQPDEKLASDSQIGLTIKEFTSGESMSFNLKGSDLTDGINQSGKYTLDMTMPKQLTDIPEVKSVLDALNGAEIEMILSAENGLYLRSSLISMLTGGVVPQGAWLSMDINALYQQMFGLDLNQITEQAKTADFTMGKLLRALFESGELSNAMYTPAPVAVDMFASIYEGMFGNDVIDIQTSGSRTTYTLKSDTNKIFGGMVKTGLITEEDVKELASMMKFDMEMRVVMSSNAVTDMTMKMNMDMDTGSGHLVMKADIKGDARKADGTISISVPGEAEIALTIKTDARTTNESPLTKPADGETVITLDQFVSLLGITSVQ